MSYNRPAIICLCIILFFFTFIFSCVKEDDIKILRIDNTVRWLNNGQIGMEYQLEIYNILRDNIVTDDEWQDVLYLKSRTGLNNAVQKVY